MDTIRPRTWDDYIGQERLKARLRHYIALASEANEPLVHTLLVGPPGVGKTTLALLTADELEEDLRTFVMPISPEVFASTVRSFQGIMFADEIHRLKSSQQEDLLSLLEDGYLQKKNGARIYNSWLTIIGATTEPESLIPPLYDRFTFKPMFDPYTEEQMLEMVTSMAVRRDIELSDEILEGISTAAAGIPRNARHLIDAARALVLTGKMVDLNEILGISGVTQDGLTDQHIQYLKVLNAMGGKSGLGNICTLLRLHQKVVQELERLLIERGLVSFTPSGRELTHDGMNLVNPPRKRERSQSV